MKGIKLTEAMGNKETTIMFMAQLLMGDDGKEK